MKLRMMKILLILLISYLYGCCCGKIKVYKLDPLVTVHQFQGTKIITVSSYIIELKSRLFIYDAQYVLPEASELLEYAVSLNKTIERLYISHAHPDHYMGIQVFKNFKKFNISIYALEETVLEMIQNGPNKLKEEQDKATDKTYFPETLDYPKKIQRETNETQDNVNFIFKKLVKTESTTSLVIILPDQKMMFVGDLVYNHEHLNIAERFYDTWITVLQEFHKNYTLYNVFQAHGLPTTSLIFLENINYLTYVKINLDRSDVTNFGEFKTNLISKFTYYNKETEKSIEAAEKNLVVVFPLSTIATAAGSFATSSSATSSSAISSSEPGSSATSSFATSSSATSSSATSSSATSSSAISSSEPESSATDLTSTDSTSTDSSATSSASQGK